MMTIFVVVKDVVVIFGVVYFGLSESSSLCLGLLLGSSWMHCKDYFGWSLVASVEKGT